MEPLLVDGLVAQRLEQRTHNPLVVGSNPTEPTRSSEVLNCLAEPPVCVYRRREQLGNIWEQLRSQLRYRAFLRFRHCMSVDRECSGRVRVAKLILRNLNGNT